MELRFEVLNEELSVPFDAFVGGFEPRRGTVGGTRNMQDSRWVGKTE